MKPIRYTDSEKHPREYATAEESRKPGYLARQFARIRSEQAKIAAEQAEKVQPLKRRSQ